METLQSITSKARKAYRDADASVKKSLTDIFGTELLNQKLADRIKAFKDVCDEAGVDEADYLIPTGTNEEWAALFLKRLKLIARVFNEGWKPDTANTSQYKYYPWFSIIPNTDKPSGFGLAFGGYAYGTAYTFLGARLYYRDSATAKYVGTTFLAEYESLAQYENLSR